MNDLLPCPFCGDKPVVGYYEGEQISCPKCHVGITIKLQGSQFALHDGDDFDGYEAVYQAMKIWNTRSDINEQSVK